ncbi:sugar ABC transporter ATP-binding protein [Propylenella binzhouense]|uniref:Sugar ABC transporter ATP-binding protein n=1 Tax=Propylenella binzhouense TaxID=2555902 RepID=A0A964T2S7_9HYPH|nr:sugar ABC transporter ATP-binding protein [Propylenella binzhouense]MYZ47244.1 sugar ABC transporter ATP-binding protein [Propylenella binzhouense]
MEPARAASGARSSEQARPAISALGISKRFPGTVALENVDLIVARGEVHGLVGKNGAGKSTLLKILSGAQPPDSGRIVVGNQSFAALTPITARRAGIAAVYQNPELHLDLSVAENIFLGAEPRTRLGLVDDAEMARRTSELLGRLGLSLPPEARLGDLDIALRQQVAIAKAVRERASVLLLDEPTSALNKAQADFLFRLIRDLAEGGMAIVYISHHLDEVLAISDRVTVLRNGRCVGVVASGDVDKDDLIAMMVGQTVGETAARRAPHPPGAPLMALDGVTVPGRLDHVALTIAKGEILGLTGLTGAGARVLAEILAGIRTPSSGSLLLEGEAFRPRSIHAAIAQGVVLVPQDMRGRGLVMPMPVAQNLTMARLKAIAPRHWLNLAAERERAEALVGQLDIQPRDTTREAGLLSGGNQRKTLLGRGIFAGARLLVLEDPTEGVDVDARRQIHAYLRSLADGGTSVVFVSTDLEELIDLADRILVLRNGRIDRELAPSGLTPERLLAAIQSDHERRHAQETEGTSDV